MNIRILFFLRTLSYISVWMWSLIVPLIIFRSSGSIGLAGLTTMIEWIPRLFYSFFTGNITLRLGIKKTLVLAQLAKICAISLAMVIFYYRELIQGEIIAVVLGLAGALIQISNTQDRNDYEILGHTMINAKTITSHTAIVKACYFAGIVTGALTISFSGAILFWGGTSLLTSSLAIIGYLRHIKSGGHTNTDRGIFISKSDFIGDFKQFFLDPKIRSIYLFITAKGSLTGFFALATVFVAKDYNLARIGLVEEDIVSLRPVAAILTVLAISISGRLFENTDKSAQTRILIVSSIGFGLALCIITFIKNAVSLLGALALAEIAGAFIVIMIIEKRQNIFPIEKRESFTAFMSTSSPFSYIMGGVYMGILENKILSLDSLIFLALIIMISGLGLILKGNENSLEKPSREVLTEAS